MLHHQDIRKSVDSVKYHQLLDVDIIQHFMSSGEDEGKGEEETAMLVALYHPFPKSRMVLLRKVVEKIITRINGKDSGHVIKDGHEALLCELKNIDHLTLDTIMKSCFNAAELTLMHEYMIPISIMSKAKLDMCDANRCDCFTQLIHATLANDISHLNRVTLKLLSTFPSRIQSLT
jgi:hypothetical protein